VFSQNYEEISKSINLQRQGISGVDEDDEALDLVKFKNAYNLASKAISVLAEMYDRLITQTGV
jgi:flagellar hook-associated protein 1 FlgK